MGRRWVETPRAAAFAAVVLLLVHLGVGLRATGELALPLDDSWIHLELAKHLADGDGLAFEAGQPVTASTAPLWTALLALGFGVLDPVAWSVLLGILLTVAGVLATGRLGEALDLPPFARIGAPWVVATTPWLLWSGLSGMEVPLALALTVGGLAEHHRSLGAGETSDRRGLALLALAPLARPEALLLLGLALADRWHRLDARGRRIDLALALVGVGPTAAVYTVLGGSPLPTTLAAKAGSSGGFALAAAARFGRVAIDVCLRSLPVLTLFALPGLLRRVLSRGQRGVAALLWVPGLIGAYAVMSPKGGPVLVGNFGRYLFPLFPVVALFGLAGLSEILRERQGARRVGIGILVAVQAALVVGSPAVYRHTLEDVLATDVAAARWLAVEAPEGLLVGAQDVGAVGYLAPQRILGLVGIIEPEVHEVLRNDDGRYWEERLLGFLARKRPDLLVVFRRSYPMLTSPPDGFEVLASFERPENRTMAGTRLLILKTPWSRWGGPDGSAPQRDEVPGAPAGR